MITTYPVEWRAKSATPTATAARMTDQRAKRMALAFLARRARGANRGEARVDVWNADDHGTLGEALEHGERRRGRLGACVEIFRDPRLARLQVLAERRLIAREERHARREEPQLQVLAQEIALRRGEQRRVRGLEVADAHQALHLLPEVAGGARDRTRLFGVARALRRAGDRHRLGNQQPHPLGPRDQPTELAVPPPPLPPPPRLAPLPPPPHPPA